MAYYSITEAVGTGSPITVPVPPYLDKTHLTVYVDYLPTEAFEWVNEQAIQLIAPANRKVRVVRRTSPQARLTKYLDGTSLPGDTLEVDSQQAFFMCQEALDKATDGITMGPTTVGGVELTTAGLIALLSGQITPSQLELSLRQRIALVTAPASTIGSPAWYADREKNAREGSLQAEYNARVAAIQAEASNRAAAIADEALLRVEADSVLASRIDTVAAQWDSTNAAVQSEQTVRASEDSALASDIDTVVAFVDGIDTRLAAVETNATTTADMDVVKSNYTIKVQARSDGKQAIAGIGLAATSGTSTPTQSEIVFLADKFTFVPSAADLNVVPQPLLVAGLVNGVNTLVVPKSRMGDKLVEARMVVDGFLEARHFTAEVVKASYVDTRGLTVKDDAGNVIFSATTALSGTYIADAAITNAKIGGDLWSANYAASSEGWLLRRDGYAEFSNVKVRGDVRATSLNGVAVDTSNLAANAVTKTAAAQSGYHSLTSVWGDFNDDAVSVSMVCSGSEVLVSGSVSLLAYAGGTASCAVDVLRDGSPLVSIQVPAGQFVESNNSDAGGLTFLPLFSAVIPVTVQDTPAAGTSTYTIRVAFTSQLMRTYTRHLAAIHLLERKR